MVYNKKENKGVKRNDTPTPIWLCDYLNEIITSKYDPKCILDPCSGDSRLTNKFNCNIIEYEIKNDKDFLAETNKIDCDFVIMNPPFNVGGSGRKLSVEVFMDKVLELVDNETPIVLITPMGFRLNQRKNSSRWKKVAKDYPAITSILSLPIDTFEDTLFHTEVLFFNTPKLNPHYFIKVSD
jgi:type I restriction-modification system DNA methylase subunit